MTAAFAANTPRHIRGIGSVLEVDSTGSGQGSLERGRPPLVGLGGGPTPDWSQAKVSEHGAERLAAIYRVEELLPCLGG
jgi:hypothetical protein